MSKHPTAHPLQRALRRLTVASRRPAVLIVLFLLAALTWADFTLRLLWPALHAPHWPNPGYWVAARLSIEGNSGLIYADRETFFAQAARLGTVKDIFEANMPTTILVFLPLAPLDETTARTIWDLAMLGCYIAACALLLRALGPPRSVSLTVWALAPLFHPWRENISRGQVYPMLLLLLVAGSWGAFVSHRAVRAPSHPKFADLLAGAAYALLAVTKLYYAAVLLLALLVARRYRTLISATFLFALAVALTLALWGPDLWTRALGFALTWRDRPETAVTAYQTLNGWLTHLLRHDATWNPGPVANLPALVSPLWWACAITLGSATILILWSRRNQQPHTPAHSLLTPAFAVPLALIVAPIAEDYHFVLTLFPLVIAAAALWASYLRAWAGPDLWRPPPAVILLLGAGWLSALLLLAAPWRFNVPGVAGWQALLHYPRLYGALLLWLVIAGLLITAPRSSVTNPPD